MRIILSLLFFLSFSLYSNEDYELGKGYKVGDLPMYVGGYFSIDYQKKDEDDRYRVDDVAFLVYGGEDKLSYLVELEFKELYVKTEDDTSHDTRLYVERIYVDYNIDDKYKIRGGKFNSPVGFWNLMPINVLRATTSSPISAKIIYPNFTTGVDLSFNEFDENELQIDVVLQNNHPIDEDYNNYYVDKHYALGVSYGDGDYTLKANIGYFATRKKYAGDDKFSYALLSAKYENENYQLLAEFGSQNSSNDKINNAGYIQGLYRFTPKHIGVLRLESYKNHSIDADDQIGIIGYTYRPLYPIALKAEFQLHSEDDTNQVLFSFSVLF